MNDDSGPTPAQMYEDYLVPGIHARWAPVLLDYAAPRSGDHVLDVACGTGIVARNVGPRVGQAGRVVGLDISPDMLAVARSLTPAPGAAIEWHEGDAASLPDGPFDLVLCQQALQFFPERELAAREMRRVLKPGGRATVSVWQGLHYHPLYRALIEAQARYLGTTVETVAGPFTFGEAERLEALLLGAGFPQVEIASEARVVRLPSPERFVTLTLLGAAAFIPESEMDAEGRARMVEKVGREIEGVLQEYVDGDTVSFPMHANVAVAHAS